MSDWNTQALCTRVPAWLDAAWIPAEAGTHRTRSQVATAMEVCDRCPVRDACLSHALAFGDSRDQTIYGGLTRVQRRLLKKKIRSLNTDLSPKQQRNRHRQYEVYKSWIREHPTAIGEARQEAKRFWAKYRSNKRKKEHATATNQTAEQ